MRYFLIKKNLNVTGVSRKRIVPMISKVFAIEKDGA